MDTTEEIPNLIKLIKQEARVVTIKEMDMYDPVGAAYQTTLNLARASEKTSGIKFDALLENESSRDYHRLKTAFEKVPWTSDIPISKEPA